MHVDTVRVRRFASDQARPGACHWPADGRTFGILERGQREKGVSRPVSRVLYGPASRHPDVAAIPLGRSLPTASSNQPGRPAWKPGLRRSRSAAVVPIRSCSRWGLPCRPRCRVRGALLPHPFTLTPGPSIRGRFAFCGTFPGVAPAGRYPAPCFHGARTFLPGPQASEAAARPADIGDVGNRRPSSTRLRACQPRA